MKRWWKDVGERMSWTFVQAALAVVVTAIITSGSVTAVDWRNVLDVATVAGVLALWKGIAARKVGDPDSASTVDLKP